MVGTSSGDKDLLEEIREKEWIIECLNRNITDLNKINEELASDLMDLEYETSHSIVWNTYKKFNKRVIEKAVPSGTSREKIYSHFLIALKKAFKPKKAEPGQAPAGTPGGMPGSMKNEEEFPASYYRAFYQSILQNATLKSPFHEEMKEFPLAPDEEVPRLVTFYLPQFHQIPENDAWWGEGFTDWQNVAKAVPQYIGHYQPHLPGELGFYDLSRYETLRRQVDLARNYGIYGFCFHYYWFDGKKLLEGPLNQFLAHPDLPLNFCICWANENWTRRWDGRENEVLIAQEYAPGYEREFIRDLDPVLRDERYIRIEGKPVIIVYCAQNLPDAQNCASIWRQYCRENGIGEIFLIAAQTFSFRDPRPLGFDAAVEFPPHNMDAASDMTKKIYPLNPNFRGGIKDYAKIVTQKLSAFESPFTLFKCVVPGWDNTARRINNPLILQGSSPALYQQWLRDMMIFTKNNLDEDKQFVFINAWNEWAEGAHLEPDRKYGYAYLNATAEALQGMQKKNSSARVTGGSRLHEDPSPDYSSFFESITWEKDKFFHEGTCFSLEPLRGPDKPCDTGCLSLYKHGATLDEYRHFWTLHKDLHIRNVLEIGVWSGASLIFWHKFFRPEKIVGIDLFQRELSECYRNYISAHNLQDQVRIFWKVDQKNREFLNKIVSTEFIGPLDIVIDDGSHFYEETKISFLTLFPYITPGGLYVIEDWSWSLWAPELFRNKTYFENKTPLMDLITELTKEIGKGNEMIRNISIYENFAVIERSATAPPDKDLTLQAPPG